LFSDQTATTQPDLGSCLVGERAAEFIAWLQANMNELLHGNQKCIEYSNELTFRPPNAACASRHVILTAESTTLTLGDSDDESDEDPLPSCCLHLHGISQLVSTRHGQHRQQARKQLPTLMEEHVGQSACTELLLHPPPDLTKLLLHPPPELTLERASHENV
jgi:hypothetical protein